MLDVIHLLQPVSAHDVAGADLEYADVAVLERLSAMEGMSAVHGTQRGGETSEPDWRRVMSLAVNLLDRTKDLRVGVRLTHAALVVEGLVGLADGLSVIAGLVTTYWHACYPRLEDGGPLADSAASSETDPSGIDATQRLNVLAHLSRDPAQSHPCEASEHFHRALAAAVVVESTDGSRVLVRDLDGGGSAGGTISAGSPIVPFERIRDRCDPAIRLARAADVRRALDALTTIRRAFEQQVGLSPRVASLERTLHRVHRFLAAPDEPASPALVVGERTPGPRFPDGRPDACTPTEPRRDAAIESREEAARLLARIATFVRATQPSSPAPLFIDRAAALLEMDFADIVLTLMPVARPHIELLGGVSLEAQPA